MRNILGFTLALALASSILSAAEFAPAPQAFRQEVSRHREITNGLPAGRIESVALVDGVIRVFAAAKTYKQSDEKWIETPAMPLSETHQSIAPDGTIYRATEKGLQTKNGSIEWVSDGQGRVWGLENVLGVTFDSKGRL